jgi:hypothetical protein
MILVEPSVPAILPDQHHIIHPKGVLGGKTAGSGSSVKIGRRG